MELLRQLNESADNIVLERGLDAIGDIIKEMRELSISAINEGFMDNHRGDLERKFDELENKYIAARRMLSKVNSANISPEEKNAHKGKLMRYIDAFRKQLYSIMDEMGMSQRERQFHMERMGLDREFGSPKETFTRGPENKDMSRFRDVVNRQRNLASPEDTAKMPNADKVPNKPSRWFNRLFKSA